MGPPDAAGFFLDTPKPQLSQGDIVLAPTVILWSEQARPPLFDIPAPPPLGSTTTVPLWDEYTVEPPMTVAEGLWGPAMVVSHDCELDKEFNREVDRLIRDGESETAAAERATEMDTLDQLILLSPLVPYEDISPDQRDGIRSGDRIGFFPIPATPIFDDEAFAIDLRRIATVERRLVQRHEKLCSLHGAAASVLRFKLAEVFATRRLSTLAELEAVVGQQIRHMDIVSKSKRTTSLALYLSDGTILHLEIRAPREGLTKQVLRVIRGG